MKPCCRQGDEPPKSLFRKAFNGLIWAIILFVVLALAFQLIR